MKNIQKPSTSLIFAIVTALACANASAIPAKKSGASASHKELAEKRIDMESLGMEPKLKNEDVYKTAIFLRGLPVITPPSFRWLSWTQSA